MAKELTDLFYSSFNDIFPNSQFFCIKHRATKTAAFPIEQKKAVLYNNEIQMGDIYFTPNGDYALSGKRSKAIADNVYAFVVDFDDTADKTIKPWEGFMTHPNIIVETKKGFHCYWLLETPVSYEIMGEERSSTEKWLCEYLGGDSAATDVSRLYRLPGYRYWKKEGDGDFISTVIHFDIKDKVDFHTLYLLSQKVNGIVEREITYKEAVKSDDRESVFEDIQQFPVMDVLQDLYPQFSLHSDQGSIVESGRKTKGYKHYRQKNCVVPFSGHDESRPKGGPFSVAKHKFNSNGEVFKYFAEKWGIGKWEKKSINIIKPQQTKKALDNKAKEDITIELGEHSMIISYSEKKIYSSFQGGEWQEILNGVVHPKGFYKRRDPKTGHMKNVYYMTYEKISPDTGEHISGDLFLDTLGAKGAFKTLLSKEGLTWLGGKVYTDFMETYIYDVHREYTVIDKLGLHEHGLLISQSGNYVYEEGDSRYIIDIGGVKGRGDGNVAITLGENDSLDHVKIMLSHLRDTYYTPIATCMFLSFIMSFFVKFLRKEQGIPIPLAMITGVSQAGKSQLREAVQRMFGVFGTLVTSAEATEFSVVAMAKNYTPLVVTEYDNNVVRFSWDHLLKNTFDTGFMTRGTAAQTVNIYELNCWFLIDGETGITTNSVRTRTIFMQAQKKYRKKMLREIIGTEYDIWSDTEYNNKINVNSYFFNNSTKIDGVYRLWDKYKKEYRDIFKEYDKAEKDRVIENFALLASVADVFGLYSEEIRCDILQLCTDNIKQLGGDNLVKILRDIFNTGIQYNMKMYVKDKTIHMEYTPNIHKFKDNKDQDTRSNISNINSMFFPEKDTLDDLLIVPLSFFFDTKDAHRLLNTILDNMFYDTRRTPDPAEEGETRGAIRSYAEANGYTHSHFYDVLTSDHGDYFEHIKDKGL